MKTKLLCMLFALCGLSAFSQAQVPSYVPTNGLQAWYPFSGNANDLSGNGHNGVTTNVTLTTDRCGNPNSAYLFNGVSSYINIPDTFFNNGWKAYTVSLWFNSDSILNPKTANYDQAMFNTNPHYGMELAYNWGGETDKYNFLANSNPATVNGWGIFSNGEANSATKVTAKVWNHIVMVKDSLTYYMYLNGALNATFTTTDPTSNYYCALVLGNITNNYASESFWGSLDDYGIWDRALSASEISGLYKGSCPTSCNLTATITSAGSTNICQGTADILQAGTGFNSYKWSNGDTTQSILVTAAGPYTCTVTQGACSAVSNTITITVKSVPPATISANGPTTFCQGGTVTLKASTGSFYLWSNGKTTASVKATADGHYTVTVTQSDSCSAVSGTVIVQVNRLPEAYITPSGPTGFCPGGSVKLTANSGTGYKYEWNNGSTAKSITVKETGTFQVTVTNENLCGEVSLPLDVIAQCDSGNVSGKNSPSEGSLNSNTDNGGFSVSVYPNPYSGEFHLKVISGSNENMNVKIFDISGRLLDERTGVTYGNDIILGNGYSAGIYLVQVYQGETSKVMHVVKTE